MIALGVGALVVIIVGAVLASSMGADDASSAAPTPQSSERASAAPDDAGAKEPSGDTTATGNSSGDDAIDPDEVGDQDHPLAIKVGKAFSVRGFDYAEGWKLTNDFLPDIEGLKVTNNRPKKDSALIEIKFWTGSEIIATFDCTSDGVAPGTTDKLSCLSGDDFPKKYDKVTVNDMF